MALSLLTQYLILFLFQSYFLIRCWNDAKVSFEEHVFTDIIENTAHCIGNDVDISVQLTACMALLYLTREQMDLKGIILS